MNSDNNPSITLTKPIGRQARLRHGRLQIFFGAATGVGKTYAMLAAARTAMLQGKPLVVGALEGHGRSATEAMACGLPRLPLQQLLCRDRVLPEFDLDAALAFGAAHPGALVLLDELAHDNLPGSRHPKRWQDAEELLNAGIDVWTTLNVQHLESLSDVVSSLNGGRVWETLPDRLFDQAHEVVVIDLPPAELLQRIKADQVDLPQQATPVANNLLREGNLQALRKLTLRRAADRLNHALRDQRSDHSVRPATPDHEALLACVVPGPQGKKVVRTCAHMAARLGVPWHAIHIETLSTQSESRAQQQQTLHALTLAQKLGATTATISAPDVAGALVRYAHEHKLTRLVLGRSGQRHWPWQPTLADRISRLADDLDVLQVRQPVETVHAPATAAPHHASEASWRWQGYATATLACAAITLLATVLIQLLELSNLVMLYLVAVVGAGLRHGRGPAVFAAFLSVVLFDFFLVPPRFSFAISDMQYAVTFAIMLLVALVVSQLTTRLTAQFQNAILRENRVRSLYEMSRDLSSALRPEQVAVISARFLQAEFGIKSTLLATDDNGGLHPLPGGEAVVDTEMARQALSYNQAVGYGTSVLPSSHCLLLPLRTHMRVRGILALQPNPARPWGPEQRRLLDTCASLLTISLERIHYIEAAQTNTFKIESERLRNSLLSAISHDLRTPLASLVGMAETLGLMQPPLTQAQRELTQSIQTSALRMNAVMNNLLDMARLQGGAVHLNCAWQPLEEVVGSALAAGATLLAGRDIQVTLADDLPLLYLDAVLMERVLVNLLENAAKYTPPGSGIELSAQVIGHDVKLTVDDQGPGLPGISEERLFEKFERGSRKSATPGMGLGLAICRAIVLAHGGTISARDRWHDGKIIGAQFAIMLPRGNPPRDDGSEIPIKP